MKKYMIIAGALLVSSCHQADPGRDNLFPWANEGKWIDLTYDFSEETLYWPTAGEGFKLDTVSEGFTDGGYYYAAFAFCASEHGWTHLDAPIHFAEGMRSTDEISIDQLTGQGILIDLSDKALQDRDYQISQQDLMAWENENVRIENTHIILLKTGYGRYYPDAKEYLGTDKKGDEGVENLHFPGLHPEAAKWLAQKGIKAIGIDTPSIDRGQSKAFEAHQELMKANIPVFENVANLDNLPIKNFYVIALPMKIKGGSGAPLRIIAWVR